MAHVGALILLTARVDATVAFYKALGLDLQPEQHDEDDPVHYAADVHGCHVAVFAAEHDGASPPPGAAGETMAGFRVASTEDTVDAVRRLGAHVLQEPADYPWGVRALVVDPDGRRVEVFTPPPDQP